MLPVGSDTAGQGLLISELPLLLLHQRPGLWAQGAGAGRTRSTPLPRGQPVGSTSRTTPVLPHPTFCLCCLLPTALCPGHPRLQISPAGPLVYWSAGEGGGAGGGRRACRGTWVRVSGATGCDWLQAEVMARPGLLLLLLLLASPPLQPSSLPRPDTTEGKAAIVGLILSALERATLFLEERLPGINLDGVVGFQVLEVQLRGVQETWTPDPLLRPLSLRARQLADKLAALLRRSIFYLELSDPKYLREFRPSLQPGFWKLPRTWTRTNGSLVYPAVEPEDSFSEESSDACLVQLLGTGTNSSQPCGISDFCWTLMTQPNCSGYRLSHQLLFFLWARMQGCTKGLFRQSQHYISIFCANMMDLNRRAEAIGYAYPTRDLFMENIMLCGISGFSDFYKLRWLEAILSWQRPQEGCFGKPAARKEGHPKAPPHQQHVLRVKRREKQFTDGCSCHNTAMAVAALGGFLYVLAEPPPAQGERHLSTQSPPGGH